MKATDHVKAWNLLAKIMKMSQFRLRSRRGEAALPTNRTRPRSPEPDQGGHGARDEEG